MYYNYINVHVRTYTYMQLERLCVHVWCECLSVSGYKCLSVGVHVRMSVSMSECVHIHAHVHTSCTHVCVNASSKNQELYTHGVIAFFTYLHYNVVAVKIDAF